MDAVRLCGQIVKEAAEATKDNDSLGCAKLVIFCNAPDDNPFMAGAFLGVTEADAVINVGVSGPGVVKKALEKVRGKGFETQCKPGKMGAGLSFLKEVCRAAHTVNPTVKVFAIGGIKPDNIKKVLESGADGGCMMSWFMQQD